MKKAVETSVEGKAVTKTKNRRRPANTTKVGIHYIKARKQKEAEDKKDLKTVLDDAEIVAMAQGNGLLSKEEERLMIERYKNDRDLLNLYLFNHNVRAADNLAGRYFTRYQHTVKNCNYALEDFVSSAKQGLWIAATRFDIDKNIKFITYATPWIFKFLIKYFYEQENMLNTVSLNREAYNDADEEFHEILDSERIDPASVEFEKASQDFILPQDTTVIDAVNRIESYKMKRGLGTTSAATTSFNDAVELTEDEAKAVLEKLKTNYKKISDEMDKQVFLYVCRKTLTKMKAAIQDRGGFEASICNDVDSFIKEGPSGKKQLMKILKTDDEENINKMCISLMQKYNFE